MYVSRDKDGNIKGYTRWPSRDSKEELSENDPELVAFIEKINAPQVAKPLDNEEIQILREYVEAQKRAR